MTITLSEDRLMEEAEREGLVLDATVVGASAVRPRRMASEIVETLRHWVTAADRVATLDVAVLARFRSRVLSAFIDHLGRTPLVMSGLTPIRGRERVVARARAFIDAHLDEPISVNDIAVAAGASRRSLQRAFFDVLEESPHGYVNRLRLHRIRSELVHHARAPRIAEASNRWRLGELGCMFGRYKSISAYCRRKRSDLTEVEPCR